MGDEKRDSRYQLNLIGENQMGLYEERTTPGPVGSYQDDNNRSDYDSDDGQYISQRGQLGLDFRTELYR